MHSAGSSSSRFAAAAVVVVVLASSAACCRGQLANDFYAGKCNTSVETIIRSAVQARHASEPRIVAGLLHMIFHDCFVQVSRLSTQPHTHCIYLCA
jgi:peroxidase